MHNPLIVALDVPDGRSATKLVEKLAPVVGFFKIGSELFTAEGPQIVKEIINFGAKVFLDLKYYDIPATVSKAVAAATRLGLSMLIIHTSGATQMIKAAEDAARTTAIEMNRETPLILGVTVLTSMSENELQEIGINSRVSEQVSRLAKLAINAGLRGLVCSPLELKQLRSELPQNIILVTPGIRFADDSKNDQKRITTPAEAIQAGANYIVVGRPITAASDPRAAAERILNSIPWQTI